MDRDNPTPAPKVSVSMITYNHEPFVAEAIEGVLMQDVDFKVDLWIGEDHSTDRTRDIVLSYQKRHPDIIRVPDSVANIGPAKNFIRSMRSCKGEYVALLDGDDYWVSPLKLQKQARFLDTHPECSMVCHAVMKRFDGDDSRQWVQFPWRRRPRYRFADVATWLQIQTSSIMLRRSVLADLPGVIEKFRCGDWGLLFLMARKGEIGYIDEVMGVHRVHASGMWSEMRKNRIRALESNIAMLDQFLEILEPGEEQHRPTFERAKLRRYYDLAHAHLDAHDQVAANRCFRLARQEHWYEPRIYAAEPMKYYVKRLSPRLYTLLLGAKRLCLGVH